MTGLAGYWPDSKQVAECIKREAETVSEAVLLAVHQTMPLSVRNAGSPNEQEADEKAFLDAFLAKDLPEGVLIQPVTGTSGAGKSHLIRWLDAQLKRDKRANKMVVVRIPKTASLRNVVELILEPLSKDKRFDQAKADLRRAVEEVTPETASIRLAGGIEIALKELAKKLRARLVADPNGPDAPELTVRLDHARRLPNYLNDPVLEEHFKKNIFTRIIAGSVRAERGHEVDPTARLFSADDLKLPPGIKLGESANAVQLYYGTILMARDGEGFASAADILNEILDPAIGEVFRLTQSLGGMTLQELILSIRQLLLEDGRELVLLIEDFAALSGIQETLLAVCIQEAVRDGRLVRAPMRTAIAITDGYLIGRDTILTRAKRVWQVRTSLGTEDAFEGTRALVAAYLNAARWGSKELERRFKASGSSDDLTGWITTYAEEDLSSDEATLLGGFGFGPKNVPLFPYNDAAIRNLARRHLSEGGQVLFKPRSIINFILRDVLERRELFLRGAFPPEKFEEAVAKAEVASWLSRAPAEHRGRLESTIVYWGDNPGTLGALAQVPEAIFEAFKLKTPRALGLTPVAPPPRTSTPAPAQKTAKAEPKVAEPDAAASEDPDRKRWSDTLQGWASGQLLQQRDARHLRIPLGELLNKSMNWNALRMSRASAPPPFITIHNAAGNDASAAYKLELSKEPGDPDGRLRKGLLAIALYEKNNRSWDYPGGDLDSAAAANLVDRLAKQYAADIEALAHGEIAWLADQLMVQARVLGHSFRETNKAERVAEIVLGPIEVTFADGLVPDSAEDRWQQLRQAAHRLRPELQKLFLARLGCFQGTGATTYGIDTVRLAKALKGGGANKAPRECTQGELGNHISALKDAFLRGRVQPVAQTLRDFSDAVVSTFGKDFDKEEYLREAKSLVDSVTPDIWPPNGERRQALSAAIEEFRKTRLQDTVEKIRRIPEGDLSAVPVMDLVSVASQIDFAVIARTKDFMRRMALFMSGVEQMVTAKERTAGDADPAALAVAIEKKLDEIATAVSSLS